jgi:phosphoglycerate dehydrogenase-like enzyme
VIFVFQSGGASQRETFDPKRDAPDGSRREYGTTPTELPGVGLGSGPDAEFEDSQGRPYRIYRATPIPCRLSQQESTMKVLFLRRPPSPLQPWYDGFLTAVGGRYPVELQDPDRLTAEQFRGVEVVVDQGGSAATRAFVDAAMAAGVKLWQVLGTGVDHMDIGYFLEKRLPLANTPGPFSAVALAEHALFLMLCLAKNLSGSQRLVRSKVFYTPANEELEGKVLGLIGLGASGRELARRAGPMGMRVMAIDAADVPPAVRQECRVEFFGGPAQLDRVLAEADYLSVHTPLTRTTRHLVGRAVFERMKPTAVLINVARGPIVDEAALVEALRAGRLRGAGLDVFEQEPADPDNPLLHMDNVIATQHIAGTTTGTARRRGQACADNVARVAQGLAPLYEITAVE